MRATKRWGLLGLHAPFSQDQPASVKPADLLMFALRAPDETEDPIVGIVESASVDLRLLASLMRGHDGLGFLSDTLMTIGRRVEMAGILLRQCDRLAARETEPETQPNPSAK